MNRIGQTPALAMGIELVVVAGHQRTPFPDRQGQRKAVSQRDSPPFGLELARDPPEI
jgi:hypothetical protein